MCPCDRDWTELIEVEMDVDAKFLDRVASPQNGQGQLLHWLDYLDSICDKKADELFVYIPEYTSESMKWGYNFKEDDNFGMPLFVHIEQHTILDKVPDLEYHGNAVTIHHKNQPKLILEFKRKIDGNFRSTFATPNLRVWHFVEQTE